MAKHGHVHWTELNTRDAAAAKTFYEESLGMSFDSMPMPDGGTYWLMKDGDEMTAGIFDITGTEFDGIEPTWLTYFAVDEIDARFEKAVANGATVLKEPWDIPGIGRTGLLSQPDGVVVAWMQPAD